MKIKEATTQELIQREIDRLLSIIPPRKSDNPAAAQQLMKDYFDSLSKWSERIIYLNPPWPFIDLIGSTDFNFVFDQSFVRFIRETFFYKDIYDFFTIRIFTQHIQTFIYLLYHPEISLKNPYEKLVQFVEEHGNICKDHHHIVGQNFPLYITPSKNLFHKPFKKTPNRQRLTRNQFHKKILSKNPNTEHYAIDFFVCYFLQINKLNIAIYILPQEKEAHISIDNWYCYTENLTQLERYLFLIYTSYKKPTKIKNLFLGDKPFAHILIQEP